MDKSMLEKVYLKASVSVDKSLLQQVHFEASVAVHEVIPQNVWPWISPQHSRYVL